MRTSKLFPVIFLTVFLFLTPQLTAQIFEHPGIFNKESDYAFMRQKVAQKAEPWYTAWLNLKTTPEASLSWTSHATATVIRGGTGDNISVMYRDVASAYQHALIYKISGETAHAAKAVEILNSWSAINKAVSGNADRYLAAGLNGYQWANAAEMMRGYPGFDVERFKNYLLNVFYFPMNERFLLGNEYGSAHNDACATNYRVNWDICNMNAMMAISVFCDYKTGFDKVVNYFRNGDGTGNIKRAVNYVHTPVWGQWEESGRDQGHVMGGLSLYALFCEMAWNQGLDLYSCEDFRFRKGAEYVARYNIMTKDSAGSSTGKYNDLPYTSYSRQMGSNCSWYTEPALSPSVRGKYGSSWELIYNHYARRLNQGDKIKSIAEILRQQPSTIAPSVAIHPDTYDTPGFGALTFCTDSGGCLLPWTAMDLSARTIVNPTLSGTTQMKDSLLILEGAGAGFSGIADEGRIVCRRMLDDGSLVVKIDSVQQSGTNGKAGIAIRENLEQNARCVFAVYNRAKGLIFGVRDTTGKFAREQAVIPVSLPVWIKLERNDNTLRAFYGKKEGEWYVLDSVKMSMSRQVYAGCVVSSALTDTRDAAVFSPVRFVQQNVRPFVSLTTPVKNFQGCIAPANIFIKGNAYDTDGTVDRTEVYLNDTLRFTLRTPVINTTLGDLPEGHHLLYLKTFDTKGASSKTDTVPVLVGQKTTKLPWYRFSESRAGALATDSSGNLMWATLLGSPAYVAGKSGNALQLDGTDDCLKLPASFLNKLSEFSISMWVNPAANTTWARIFDFGTDINNYMMLTVSNGNGLMFECCSGGIKQSAVSTVLLQVGGWSFVTVTLADDVLSVYVNGALAAKNTAFTLRPYMLGATAVANYIGKSMFTADPYFKGSVDEIHFYNRALTVGEIQAEMTATAVNQPLSYDFCCIPNPARDCVSVEVPAGGSLKLYDALGRLHKTIPTTGNTTTFNVSNLRSGIYAVVLTAPGFKKQQTLLVCSK